MLDIRFIRDNQQEVKDSIAKRGLKVDIDKLLSADKKRIGLIEDTERLRSSLKAKAKPTHTEIAKLKKIKLEYEKNKGKLDKASADFESLMADVPNIIAKNTPEGGEDKNRVEKAWGDKDLGFRAKNHLELSKINDLVDFDRGAKVSGNKFYFLKDKLARLWLAVVNFSIDELGKDGYSLMLVPNLVRQKVSFGTGFLPRGEEKQIYSLESPKLDLIATAEMPLSAYHMDELIDVKKPKLYCGLSSCFRQEAGAYGKYSKGLYRVHQFEKLEMYAYCEPDKSDKLLQSILDIQQKICQKLGLPYRVVRIATGDLSAPAYEKYDIEYYSPVDNKYRELTSCSNCTDFQTRRLNIRYKNRSGKNQFAHSLNGTVVTSTRTLIAILENYQLRDSSVEIPKVLQKYYGDKKL